MLSGASLRMIEKHYGHLLSDHAASALAVALSHVDTRSNWLCLFLRGKVCLHKRLPIRSTRGDVVVVEVVAGVVHHTRAC